MTDYKNYNVFGISKDYDLTKIWRFAVVYEKPSINGITTLYDWNRIKILFKRNNVEMTESIFASLMGFKSNLTGLDLYLKNLFANNGNKTKIKNMGVIEDHGESINRKIDETGQRVIAYIGILPTNEKKIGVKVAMMNGEKTKYILRK